MRTRVLRLLIRRTPHHSRKNICSHDGIWSRKEALAKVSGSVLERPTSENVSFVMSLTNTVSGDLSIRECNGTCDFEFWLTDYKQLTIHIILLSRVHGSVITFRRVRGIGGSFRGGETTVRSDDRLFLRHSAVTDTAHFQYRPLELPKLKIERSYPGLIVYGCMLIAV